MRLGFPAILLACALSCATGVDQTGADAGSDGPGIVDAGGFDQTASDRSVPDTGFFDGGGFDSKPQPFDGGIFDATPFDAGLPGEGGCVLIPCSSNAFPPTCPFLWNCSSAIDASPNDGLCIPVFPPQGNCSGNPGECPAGTACLMAAQMCLSAQAAQCICNDPMYASACGPPWQSVDAGGDGGEGGATDGGAPDDSGDAGD